MNLRTLHEALTPPGLVPIGYIGRGLVMGGVTCLAIYGALTAKSFVEADRSKDQADAAFNAGSVEGYNNAHTHYQIASEQYDNAANNAIWTTYGAVVAIAGLSLSVSTASRTWKP